MYSKDKFYKIFGNLPIATRDEIILYLKGDGVSWRVAKLEIDNDTALSKIILEKLEELRII